MATIDDLVKKCGVSRSTVFRFLNGNNVRPDAKKSIIQAMKDLNYKTDELYKFQNIEIEISISSNFESFQGFSQVVECITRKADEKGIKVNIARRTKDQIPADYENWNNGSTLKGIIVVGKNKDDTILEAEMLKKYNIPHVFVNRIFDDPSISYVAVDLRKGACDIVDYLISKGYKDIAVVGCPTISQVDVDKLSGYKDAFAKNETKVSDKFYYEIENMDLWQNTIENILSKPKLPDAFFSICDSLAFKFIKIANSKGLSIPKDLALVGMDDIEIAHYAHPSITTIHVPFCKMGELAVEHLLKLISDDEINCIKTIIKHHIVERESC